MCTTLCNMLGAALVFCSVALVSFDALGRILFAAPIAGTPEMVAFSVMAAVFLQAPNAYANGIFPRLGVLQTDWAKRRPRLVAGIEVVFSIIVLVALIAVATNIVPLLERAWTRGTFGGAVGYFQLPLWPGLVIILISLSMLVLQIAVTGYHAALQMKRCQ